MTEGVDEGISPKVRVVYDESIRSLLVTYRLASQPYMLQAVPEAHAALRDHYNNMIRRRRSGEFGDIDSSVSRWTEPAWRLAVGLHAGLHGSDAINQHVTLATVQSAIRIEDWFARQQLELIEVSRTAGKREFKDKIICVLSDYPGGLSARKIYRSLRVHASFAAALLSELASGGVLEVSEVRPAEGGHPQRLYKPQPFRG